MVSGAFSEEMLVDHVVSSGLGFGFETIFNNFITDLADTGNSLLLTDNTIHPSQGEVMSLAHTTKDWFI